MYSYLFAQLWHRKKMFTSDRLVFFVLVEIIKKATH